MAERLLLCMIEQTSSILWCKDEWVLSSSCNSDSIILYCLRRKAFHWCATERLVIMTLGKNLWRTIWKAARKACSSKLWTPMSFPTLFHLWILFLLTNSLLSTAFQGLRNWKGKWQHGWAINSHVSKEFISLFTFFKRNLFKINNHCKNKLN